MEKFINQVLANPELIRLVFVAVVFLAVALFAYAVIRWLSRYRAPELRRVKAIIGPPAADQKPGSERYKQFLDNASPYLVPNKGKELSNALTRLHYAGYLQANAAAMYYGLKIVSGLAVGLPIYFYMQYVGTWSILQVLFSVVLGGFIGMLIPSKLLDIKVSKRQERLRRGFPDALDLLVVSIEAGLGFNAAIDRVSRELLISHPLLANELMIVNDEIRAGLDRPEALRNLYTRTGLEDIRGLTVSITQSLRFGTSVAESLRVYAEEYRDKRMQKAEEKAAMIGTKLIFPLVLCLFPSFFLVMIGPAILGVLTALGR